MKSPINDSIPFQNQQPEKEVPIYTPEVTKQSGTGNNLFLPKNKELMLSKLLSKGFNFGIYRVRRSHHVRDEA